MKALIITGRLLRRKKPPINGTWLYCPHELRGQYNQVPFDNPGIGTFNDHIFYTQLRSKWLYIIPPAAAGTL
jgi:hypothetical protein